MIRPSFIPEKATRDLRELTRRRKKLVEQVASERRRVQKQLEYGNVKLGIELSDVLGLSGQLMLKALVDENWTPEQIAELAQGSLKKKAAIAEALRGQRLSDTRKEMIRSSMRHMVFLELEIEQLDGLVTGLIERSGQQKRQQLLQTIPGIRQEASGNLLAECQRQRIIRHHTRRLRRLGCWLAPEKLTPLEQWYVTRCLPNIDPPPPKRRGRK